MQRDIGISFCMEQGSLPRILILTAGYGDGHNSAARGIEAALVGRAEVRVVDLCATAMPRLFRLTRDAYLLMISRMSWLWKLVYSWTDKRNLAEHPLKCFAPVENLLECLLEEWQPQTVICTYMLYPYMLDSFMQRTGKLIPYITVVTDSFVINKTWVCSDSQFWAVTDCWTQKMMEKQGISQDKLCVTGFPIHPVMKKMANHKPPLLSGKEGRPFRVLYFAQRSARLALAELEGMLENISFLHVTCILGRHFRRIYPHIQHLRAKYGHRLTIRGWSHRIPFYLADVHVVVGKAGGAAVHEALGAARPMLVNFFLSGQEEGNVRLLEKLGGGWYVPDVPALVASLQGMMADGGAQWRQMHENLLNAGMNRGSDKIADLTLKLILERNTN